MGIDIVKKRNSNKTNSFSLLRFTQVFRPNCTSGKYCDLSNACEQVDNCSLHTQVNKPSAKVCIVGIINLFQGYLISMYIHDLKSYLFVISQPCPSQYQVFNSDMNYLKVAEFTPTIAPNPVPSSSNMWFKVDNPIEVLPGEKQTPEIHKIPML